MADSIPWDVFEKKYSRLFKVKTGNVAKPLRTALGALVIQTKFQYSDRELVEQITENPYLQYFIGLPGYQEEPPFDPSAMVLFRKRINAQMKRCYGMGSGLNQQTLINSLNGFGAENRIEGVVHISRVCLIPKDTEKPVDRRRKVK